LAQGSRITFAFQVFSGATLHSSAMYRLVICALALTAMAEEAPFEKEKHNQFMCAMNGGAAADSLIDATAYIWASVERCENSPNAVQCSVDITAAIAAVSDMINFLLAAVDSCGGGLMGRHQQCGRAVGHVTASLAHIASSSTGIAEHCPNPNRPPIKDFKGLETYHNSIFFRHNLAHCMLDVKSLSHTIFYASGALVQLKNSCPGKERCTYNILGVVSAFAWMGKFIAGAVGHCSKPVNDNAACASEVMGLIGDLDYLASAGDRVHHFCSLSESERHEHLRLEHLRHPLLYLANKQTSEAPAVTSLTMNMGLVAFIPITAVLSFIAGRRMKAHATTRAIKSECADSKADDQAGLE